MKTSISTIALATVLALAGTSSFAGSGNDAAAVDAAATKAHVTSSAAADAADAKAAKAAAFDPQINVRMGNQYLLLSV